MRPPAKAHSAAERYDRSRLSARDHRLPPNYPRPQPTSAWPPENVALLEDFRVWLLSSGTSRDTVDHLYIPMAGNALGLNLKPHRELDLDADLRRGLGYVQAKRLSAEWTGMCRNALAKFRTFLRQQRGAAEVALRPLNHQRYCADLPDWLVQELLRYQHSRQHQWRPARLNEQISRFWSGHSRMWRWLCSRYTITTSKMSGASTSSTTPVTNWLPAMPPPRSIRTCATSTPSCSICRSRTMPCPRPSSACRP